MQLLQGLFAQITFLSVLIYFGLGLIVWYFGYGLEMWINGGSLGRGKWWVFKCLWEEMLWFLPGGLAKRTNYIRQMVQPQANSDGYVGGYSYEQIRKENLYERVAKNSLGNVFYFWGVNVILMFFLWPIFLVAFVTLVVVGYVKGIAAYFIPALRD